MAFLLALSFLLPMINGFAIVKVHRNALYHPQFWCSFLGNASLSNDASIQTCIWTCTHKRLCRTIVYYNNEQICSMFDEHVRLGRIVSSEDVRASVIVLIETNSRIVDPTCFDPIVPCSPITESPSRIRWSFDGHANDLYNVYNGTEENGATYVSPGYNGQGSALSLKGSQSQYVLVPTYKNLTYTSFTWEIWAYPLDLVNHDNLMLGLCETRTDSSCLYLMIRNNASYFAFWRNDCVGKTIILPQRWHHFAFVYDYPLQTQYIYLNGRIECTKPSAPPFRASRGAMIIGAIKASSDSNPIHFWTGYLDQVSYVSQAKSAAEILTDATLVAYYPFDHPTDYHLDVGPNDMAGISVNLSSAPGHINRGIEFNETLAYLQAYAFTLLGESEPSYSIAVWVKRTSSGGTIVHLSRRNDSIHEWCLSVLGLSASNEIIGQNWNDSLVAITGPVLPINAWTHLVTSYSPSTGLSLWVNGSLVPSPIQMTIAAANTPLFLTLGSRALTHPDCATGDIDGGQFYGMMDELRVYSRELDPSEICSLARPRD